MPPFDKLRRATVPAPNFHIPTRVMQDRRLANGAGLYATGANFQAADTRTIVLPRRGPHEPGRTARLTLRFGTVVLKRPQGSARDLLPSVRLTLVEVAEHDPPAGVEPLHRRRLTTHDVTSVDAAWQIVAWDKLRRIIEPLFRIPKKQGLQLEDSQIASAERLLKLATIATKAAALILQLVQARDGRRAPNRPAWPSHKRRGRPWKPSTRRSRAKPKSRKILTPGAASPEPPGSSRVWAAGPSTSSGGYCSSRPPGPITFKHGLEYFRALATGWKLRNVCIP